MARETGAGWSAPRSGVVFAASLAVVLVAAVLSLAAIGAKEARFSAAAGSEPLALAVLPVADSSWAGRSDSPAGTALPEVVAAVQAARRGDPIPSGLIPPIGQLRNEPLPYSLPRGCVPVANSSESSSKICPK